MAESIDSRATWIFSEAECFTDGMERMELDEDGTLTLRDLVKPGCCGPFDLGISCRYIERRER